MARGTNFRGGIQVDGAALPSAGSTLKVGADGTVITKIIKGTVSVDPSTITAISGGTAYSHTVTITGAAVGDILVLQPRQLYQSGAGPINYAHPFAYISAANTATLVWFTFNGAVSDPAAATWDYLLIKS